MPSATVIDLYLHPADALSKKWHSDVYEHYMRPKIIQNARGAVMHRFVCKKYVGNTV